LLMRLVFAAFAGHAYTDNVLISTSACVFFTLITAVFARARLEAPPFRLAVGAGRGV